MRKCTQWLRENEKCASGVNTQTAPACDKMGSWRSRKQFRCSAGRSEQNCHNPFARPEVLKLFQESPPLTQTVFTFVPTLGAERCLLFFYSDLHDDGRLLLGHWCNLHL